MSQDINQLNNLTKKEWVARYWFSPLQMIQLVNPRDTDYRFMVEMRHFIIKASDNVSLPGTVANVYLSQMTRILAQEDNKMQHLSDYNLMAQYYDKLIVDVTSMVQEVNNEPAYLSKMPARTLDTPTETPPWQNKQAQQAPVAPVAPEPKTPAPEVKEEVKEFKQGDNKYKMIVNKSGNRMYYMNDKLTSEAKYSKAASML
jgi:hypothetical protein